MTGLPVVSPSSGLKNTTGMAQFLKNQKLVAWKACTGDIYDNLLY
jgi:hypothetical protein